MRLLRVALVQMNVGDDTDANLENATKLIAEAKKGGAKLVVLPECFNSPYGSEYFNKYSESIPNGQTCEVLSEAAKEHSIYLVGGSFPEVEDYEYYNTCTVWNPDGELIAMYRKMHLFDIDIPGQITVKESRILNPGNELAIFDIEGTKIGLGICYDMRFEELAKLYRLEGCEILIYPGAFDMFTGPTHWELLQRARALDNQVFVIGVSSARNEQNDFVAWGHSQVTNPWGKVTTQAGHEEEIVYDDINLSECDRIRQQIPIFHQRRSDIYNTIKYKS